jgi:hypothetical protein
VISTAISWKFDLVGSDFGTYFLFEYSAERIGQCWAIPQASRFSSRPLIRSEFPGCGSSSTKRTSHGRRKREQLDFRIENIRFVHDPNWNKRFFSLQSARDGGNWFWQVTHSLVIFETLSV